MLWGSNLQREYELVRSIFEPQHNKLSCAPSKDRSAWASEYLLCAIWVTKDPNLLQAASEGSNQTGQVPRLIWVFNQDILLVLSCCGSSSKMAKSSRCSLKPVCYHRLDDRQRQTMNRNHRTRLFTSSRAYGNETVHPLAKVTWFTEVVVGHGMAWYMVWPGRQGKVYGMVW